MFPIKESSLHMNNTILTQKENWIWLAAFVTNGVDAERIPKSGAAKERHRCTSNIAGIKMNRSRTSVGSKPANSSLLSRVLCYSSPFSH